MIALRRKSRHIHGHMKTECPKCTSESAWYTRSGPDIVLRCFCGYYKVVQTKLESFVIQRNTPPAEIKLPKRGTNLWCTLVCAAALELGTSGEITRRLIDFGKRFSVSDVASYLTIMRGKGLVETTEVRRGVAGGSTWKVSDRCADLLGVC